MKRKNLPGSSREDLEKTANHDKETTTDSGSKRKLGRRGFLKAGAGAAAAALTIPVESLAHGKSKAVSSAVQASECFVPFDQPDPVYARQLLGSPDKKTVLNYTLNAEPLDWTVTCPGATPVKTRQPVFNGALPGPTLVVDPGSTIVLTLNNRLNLMKPFSQDNCTPVGHHIDVTKPACFQHTNLHFHGLQVSPCSIKNDGAIKCGAWPIDGKPENQLKFSSDDVLVDIFPGQSNLYNVVLPDMHAPGTNWYHSHLHGASAYQVSGGMAGAIIIREPGGEIVRDDLDKLFILQEIQPNDPNNWPAYPSVYGALGGTGGRPKSQCFVNGLCRPTLTMKARQTMRWRFINTTGTPNGLMTLRLIKTPTCSPKFPDPAPPLTAGEVMYLIAIDGLSFYGVNPQPVRYHIMGSGNRADFLVNLEPGTYTLLKDRFPLKSVLDPSSGQTSFTQASDRSKQVLMYIDVQPSDYKENVPRDVPTIPGKKPDYLKAIWSVDCVRDNPVKFQNPGTGQFQIDGAYYDQNQAIRVPLNTAQEWTLQNTGFPTPATPPQTNTHPFHVHLNPFQILDVPFDFEVTDKDLKDLFPNVPRWKKEDPEGWPFWDTVPIPAQIPPQTGPPGQLKIRSRFLIYNGEYVTHCHILVHEDVGMMIDVELRDLDGQGVGPGVAVHDYPKAALDCINRTSKPNGTTPKPCPTLSPTPKPTE